MKINKTIKGEMIPYRVKLIPNTMTAEVRYFMSDEAVIGVISKDFKKILLPENFLSPFISGIGRVPVKSLTLNKDMAFNAKEYNE